MSYIFSFRYRFISSNTENPGDKFYNTSVEVLPSYHQEKKEGILEADNAAELNLKRTEDGFIQVGKNSSAFLSGFVRV